MTWMCVLKHILKMYERKKHNWGSQLDVHICSYTFLPFFCQFYIILAWFMIIFGNKQWTNSTSFKPLFMGICKCINMLIIIFGVFWAFCKLFIVEIESILNIQNMVICSCFNHRFYAGIIMIYTDLQYYMTWGLCP